MLLFVTLCFIFSLLLTVLFWRGLPAYGTAMEWVLWVCLACTILSLTLVILLISLKVRKWARRRREKKSSVGKIAFTSDGYLSGRKEGRKKKYKRRRVVVVHEREDDRALAVAKIESKKGKEDKIGKDFIPDLTLKKEKHSSLTEESIVERRVYFGTKKKGSDKHEKITAETILLTKDKLTDKELKKVRDEVGNATPEFRATYEKTLKAWENHFKKEDKKNPS